MIDFDTDTRNQINARRNYLIGLWAGRRLGLKQTALSNYIHEVMQSDYIEPGPQDVIDKIKSDFDSRNKWVEENELLSTMMKIEKSVRAELLVTD